MTNLYEDTIRITGGCWIISIYKIIAAHLDDSRRLIINDISIKIETDNLTLMNTNGIIITPQINLVVLLQSIKQAISISSNPVVAEETNNTSDSSSMGFNGRLNMGPFKSRRPSSEYYECNRDSENKT